MVCCALLAPASALGAFGFISTWGKNVDPGGGTGFEVCTVSCQRGEKGAGPGELDTSFELAVSQVGNVYVTGYLTHRINEYTAAGAFVRAFGKDVDPAGGTGFETCVTACQSGTAGGGAGEMNTPVGVGVAPNGDVYVADSMNHRVDQFTADGGFVRAWGKDVDPAGGTDAEVCTTTCQAGTAGGAAGEFSAPGGVGVDPTTGDVYVADSSNHRIQQFKADGTFVRTWGKDVDTGGGTDFEICTSACKAGVFGSAAGELAYPSGVAPDGHGNVYIGDTSNIRVQQFTTSGTFVRTWGEDVANGGGTGAEICTADCKTGVNGFAEGEFNSATDVAVDPVGNVYVADHGNGRVQEFTGSGQFIRLFGKDVIPGGVTAFEICTSGCQFGDESGEPGSFYTPLGIATDCLGDVYVSDTNHERVQKFGEQNGLVPPCIAGGGGPPGGPGAPVALAAVSKLRISPSTFRAAAKGPAATVTRKRRRVHVGANASYTLNQAASVRFKVQRRTAGRKVKRRGETVCVRPNRSNRKRAHCTRFVTKGSFKLSGGTGANSFRLSGRLKGKKLAPGRYRLVAVPTANGKSGKAITRSFRIVR